MERVSVWSNSGPLLPDRSLLPDREDRVIVEMVYADSGDKRSWIASQPDDVFHVSVEYWSTGYDAHLRSWSGHWNGRQYSLMNNFADASIQARSLLETGKPHFPSAVRNVPEFLRRYGSAQFPNSERFLSLLRADQLMLGGDVGGGKSDSEEQLSSCEHFAWIWLCRNERVAASFKPAVVGRAAELADLAKQLYSSPEEPCRLWIFYGSAIYFYVYEMVSSQRIAGCLQMSDSTNAP